MSTFCCFGEKMVRFRLKELIADKEFKTGKRVSVQEISAATGISRGTLSKVLNHRGANITIDKVEKLCLFFSCRVEELIEITNEAG